MSKLKTLADRDELPVRLNPTFGVSISPDSEQKAALGYQPVNGRDANAILARKIADELFDNASKRIETNDKANRLCFIHGSGKDEYKGFVMSKEALAYFIFEYLCFYDKAHTNKA